MPLDAAMSHARIVCIGSPVSAPASSFSRVAGTDTVARSDAQPDERKMNLRTVLHSLSTLFVAVAQSEASVTHGSASQSQSQSQSLQTRSLSPAAVLFPAYVYPAPGAWDDLFAAIQSAPAQQFQVIVNIDSGPGRSAPPSDVNYVAVMRRLKTYGNVAVLGYIHTLWGHRDTGAMYEDVDRYRAWIPAGLAVDGVFLDESPATADQHVFNAIANISCYAKEQLVTARSPDPLVTLNPGCICDLRYFTLADYINVFEDTHEQYARIRNTTFGTSSKLPMARSTAMVHTFKGQGQQAVDALARSLVREDGFGAVFHTAQDGTGGKNPYSDAIDLLPLASALSRV